MKAQIAGTRDGVAWPPAGKTVELPDEEGARMCARGFAEPVVEVRVEQRPARKRAEKRG
jgi:hypothetical protein